jgi:hypothetical protein
MMLSVCAYVVHEGGGGGGGRGRLLIVPYYSETGKVKFASLISESNQTVIQIHLITYNEDTIFN